MSFAGIPTSSISEESAMEVSLYIRKLEDHLHREITTEIKRVLEKYQEFRGHCQRNMLSGLPLRHASEERPGISDQIMADFPCEINNFYYDNIAGISFSAFEHARRRPAPFTMPPDLAAMGPPTALTPPTWLSPPSLGFPFPDSPPTPHRNAIRRKKGGKAKFLTANALKRVHPDSFVFFHKLDGIKAHWILICPKQNCQSRSFSRDPIASGDAVAHFKRCKVRSGDAKTILRKYGMKVVPHRLDARHQPLDDEWVANHNKNLRETIPRSTQESLEVEREERSDSMEDGDKYSD
ncbi:hypothetical protein CORC01_11131 [Colletotrichum orchidophilum]|uniref:Uncharacterized protein n=1 Tax=Colletotrichum orchidophilum TaxID=1209926 RepID=A0A1G4AWM2_9PEZI|nr:uncharacterized protein CORC01_11131 [Colletotrichum orchidophilum]OHE93534.1 hypothetical protein CORC01_11131 [Colletotrichum orchidophilum]